MYLLTNKRRFYSFIFAFASSVWAGFAESAEGLWCGIKICSHNGMKPNTIGRNASLLLPQQEGGRGAMKLEQCLPSAPSYTYFCFRERGKFLGPGCCCFRQLSSTFCNPEQVLLSFFY